MDLLSSLPVALPRQPGLRLVSESLSPRRLRSALLAAVWIVASATFSLGVRAQTVTLYVEPKFFWYSGVPTEVVPHETPEQAFAAIDAYLRSTNVYYGQNPRVGRTWTSKGEVGGSWAYNEVFMPWAFDVMWGPAAPPPYVPGTYANLGSFGVSLRCPAGTAGSPFYDYLLVRVWYLCAFTTPVDPAPPANTDSASSSSCADPRSPEIGTPILALPGLKLKTDADVSASNLSARQFYRSDTQRFDFATDTVAMRKINDPWASPPSRDGLCMTLPYSWTGAAPYQFHCFPVVGYSSYQLGSTASSVLMKSSGTGYREFNIGAAGVRKAELAREAWTAAGGYRVLHRNTLQVMDSAGRLLSEIQPDGRGVSFSYSSPVAPTYRSRVIGIQDSFGRALQLDYNGQGLLSRVIRPDAGTTEYFYDEAPFSCSGGSCGALTSVLYPDGKRRQYLYNEAASVTSGL